MAKSRRPTVVQPGAVKVARTARADTRAFEDAIVAVARTYLDAELRRYWRWREQGVPGVDPLPSGVGRGYDYTAPRVLSSRPSGGYGPGQAADLDADPHHLLHRIHAFVTVMPPKWQRLLHWRYGPRSERLTNDRQAEESGYSRWWVDQQWRQLYLALYAGLNPSDDMVHAARQRGVTWPTLRLKA